MELPRALIPWAASLDLFPREMAHGLGPLIRRLDLALGPLRYQGRTGSGEPDGFDGLSRRGQYERLLLTEWLLAEEVPEEFSRRAAMNEHGFLDLARQEAVGARVSIALFDAGPNQLGAPRIAQIAALIVLARRAEAAGATFQWGILQQSPHTPYTGVTASTLVSFLQARSPREAAEADLSVWRDYVKSCPGTEDLWLIGGRHLAALPSSAGASLLQITDPYDPGTRSLEAIVTERGQVKPTVTLELPDDKTCARLLRDPFTIRVAETLRDPRRFATPTSNLLFSSDGNKIMARSSANTLLVFSLPRSSHETAGKPKIYRSELNAPILASGTVGQSVAMVTTTHEPRTLRLECYGKRSHHLSSGLFQVPPGLSYKEEATLPLTSCYYLSMAEEGARWLVQIGDSLLRVRHPEPVYRPESPVYEAKLEMQQVVAAGQSPEIFAFLGKSEKKWTLISFDRYGVKRDHQEFANVHSAFLGYGSALGSPYYGLLAIEELEDIWYFHTRSTDVNYVLKISENERVVGTTAQPTEAADSDIYLPPAEEWKAGNEGISSALSRYLEPALLLQDSDKRALYLRGRHESRALLQTSSPITRVAVSSHVPRIAYLTENGELAVYSLSQDAFVYRVNTRGKL